MMRYLSCMISRVRGMQTFGAAIPRPVRIAHRSSSVGLGRHLHLFPIFVCDPISLRSHIIAYVVSFSV